MKDAIGKFGERIAVDFLRKKGYDILDQNYKFKIRGEFQKGEIDIVAKKGDTICFVEVKTLKDQKGEIFPEDKIDLSKKKKLIKASEGWLIKNKIPLDAKWQIDVISVNVQGDKIKISHFENVISEM